MTDEKESDSLLTGTEDIKWIICKDIYRENRGQMPATDMCFPGEGSRHCDSVQPDDQGIRTYNLTEAAGHMESIP